MRYSYLRSKAKEHLCLGFFNSENSMLEGIVNLLFKPTSIPSRSISFPRYLSSFPCCNHGRKSCSTNCSVPHPPCFQLCVSLSQAGHHHKPASSLQTGHLSSVLLHRWCSQPLFCLQSFPVLDGLLSGTE